jgi:hypothetical protein
LPDSKQSRRGTKVAAPSKPESAGFWESSIAPFLERHSVVLACLFLVIASARIVSTYSQLTVVDDEPGHFACGLEWLSKHMYRYEAQHPPLQRVLDAIGPYLAGVRPIGGPDRNEEGAAVIARTGNVDRTVFLMRLGVLPCFWIACAVVYLWARRYWGGAVAAVAVACFSITPPVLANAGLATTDIALAAFLPAAFLAGMVWAESSTRRRSMVFGFACALAVLSKFTAIGYLAAAIVLALTLWAASRRPSLHQLGALVRERAAGFGIIVPTAAATIWAAYWFSIGRVGDVMLPAPEFFNGIADAARHAAAGHDADAYLLGETSPTGFWYFFFVALALKTPLALVLVAIVGLLACLGEWRSPGSISVIALTFGILLSTIPTRLNIGVRHVLPVYASLSIAAAVGLVAVVRMIRRPLWAAPAGAGLLLWASVSGARAHPDYLSYFNEIAAGEPERCLVQSDLDWGQGKKLLATRLRALGVKHIAIKVNAGPLFHQELYPEYPHTVVDDDHPSPGWTVISANDRVLIKHGADQPVLHGTDYNALVNAMQPASHQRPWYESVQPTERVSGYILFYVPHTR